MVSCSSCGSEVSTGADYCPRCGARVYTVSPSTSILGATVPVEGSLGNRMVRAIKADAHLYEEVEHDPKATQQVFLVIGIVAAAEAIGIALENLIFAEPLSGILLESVVGFVLTVVGIGLWSYLLYLVGTRLFKGKATPQEVWRAAGFARSPGVFYIIPFVGTLASLWMIYTNVIAARQALDVTTGKAILASIVSFLPYLILIGIVQLLIFPLL